MFYIKFKNTYVCFVIFCANGLHLKYIFTANSIIHFEGIAQLRKKWMILVSSFPLFNIVLRNFVKFLTIICIRLYFIAK